MVAALARNGSKRLTSPNGIFYGGLLLAFVMALLCAIVLFQSRHDALERARDTSRNVALIAERDIERNFELYALSLEAVVEGINQPEVMALPPHLRSTVLFDRAATADYLGSMLVLDAAGNIVIDSANDTPRHANFADRDYFTVQRDRADAGLYISAPFRSRLRNGAPSIALSRRLSHADGSFAGIVMIAINLAYFHELFGGLSLGTNGAISLLSSGGTMIMRQPFDPKVIGRDLAKTSIFQRTRQGAEGSFADRSSIDGVRRLYYYRQFPHQPLVILVAEAESDIYAAWRRRALTIGSLMGAFALAFVALSFMLGRQLRRRMSAESELQLLARTDSLTGLANRRTFAAVLDDEWLRAQRAGSVFSLLFVDIDRFKAYNDQYGHQAGDDALAAVARCIGDSIRRPSDTASRYGGEEFVVVLPDTPSEGARAVAEKLRKAITSLEIEHAGSEYGHVTASIGCASWTPERHPDVANLIKAADEALYEAKARGRNRVETSLESA